MSDRELAERLVRVAGSVALELRGGPAGVKGLATDVVTEADVRAEAAMVELLRAERPGDGVRGEEGAAVAGSGGRSWLLDPVDGTLNYARGLPAWCSAACVVDGAGALASARVRPGRRRAVQRGARLGDSWRLRTRAPRRGRGDVRRRAAALRGGDGGHRARCCGGSARCAPAAAARSSWRGSRQGRLDAWVQADVEPWDWHPGALLVAEAGGAVVESGRWRVAARSAALADELVACVGAE